MSDTDVTIAETDENASQADDTTESDTDTAEDPKPGTDESEAVQDKSGNREAAKWRTRFRDAEQTIDTLTGRVEALQKQIVTSMAGQQLADGDDLLDRVDLADLLNEDGDLDNDKIAEQITGLIESKPHLRRREFKPAGVGERGPATGPQSWADVLAG